MLLNRATMLHDLSLNSVLLSFYLLFKEVFLSSFTSIVTVAHAHFEPCLKNERNSHEDTLHSSGGSDHCIRFLKAREPGG